MKGARTGPDLKRDEIPLLIQEIITKRIVLSIVMSVYDPLTLIAPITVRLKIEMKELHRASLGWDEPLSDELKLKWIELLKLLKDAEKVRFPRCIRP